MEYLGAGGPVVSSLNVDKGIATLAININLNSHWNTLKIEHYKYYKHFTPFQKNITNITNRTRNCWQGVMRQRKEKATEKFSCAKERSTADKVSCVKKIYMYI